MNKGNHNSGKTAIARKKISRPMAWLLNNGWLRGGTLLDYGCGRGTDVMFLNELGLRENNFCYDPNNPRHSVIPAGLFDIITCFFVLNTIPTEEERIVILREMLSKLMPFGVLWIAVRNDKAKLKGWTQHDTWQGYVEVPGELIHKDNSYRLYRLDKQKFYDNLPT